MHARLYVHLYIARMHAHIHAACKQTVWNEHPPSIVLDKETHKILSVFWLMGNATAIHWLMLLFAASDLPQLCKRLPGPSFTKEHNCENEILSLTLLSQMKKHSSTSQLRWGACLGMQDCFRSFLQLSHNRLFSVHGDGRTRHADSRF